MSTDPCELNQADVNQLICSMPTLKPPVKLKYYNISNIYIYTGNVRVLTLKNSPQRDCDRKKRQQALYYSVKLLTVTIA